MQLQSFKVDEKGQYLFNNLLFSVKPYYLTPDNADQNAAQPEQILMTAGAASGQVPMFIVDEGAFEGAYLSCERNDVCLVELHDPIRKRRITGRPCHVDTIFGDGVEPFILPESIYLNKRESIIFRATDLSGQNNNIRPVIHGQRLFSERARDADLDKYLARRTKRARYIMPYMCPLDEDPTIAGNATQDIYFTQQSVAHFEVKKLTYHSTGDFKFRIRDETGQLLTNNWVHDTAGLGTAREPFILYGSWVIRAGGVVTWEIQDLSGTDNTIYLTLSGREHSV